MPPIQPFTSADPNAYVALAMQSGLAVPQVAAAKMRFAKYLSGNGFQVVPAVVDLREGGDGLDFGLTYKNQQVARGNLIVNLRPEIAGQFFQLLPGGAAVGAGSLPAIHTFHDNHASFPYSTLIVQHPGSSMVTLLSDVRFTGFTLEAARGGPLKLTAPFIAITHGASVVALTPTYYNFASPGSDDPFYYHVGASLAFGGLADSTIESWTLGLQLGTEELQAQGISLDDIAILNRDWSFSMTRRYQSPSQWAAIVYGGAANLAPTTAVATSAFMANYIYGAAGASRAFQVNIGMLSHREDAITELDPDGKTIKETITSKPLRTASAAVLFTLANGHASVYGP